LGKATRPEWKWEYSRPLRFILTSVRGFSRRVDASRDVVNCHHWRLAED
jgi:hypothetical protein